MISIRLTKNLNAYQANCLSKNAKAVQIQEVQKLLCVDAAVSDAENLCFVMPGYPARIYQISIGRK